MPTFSKDPDAVLDYGNDWSAWLATVEDTIESSDWTVPDGITQVGSDTHDDTTTTIWLEGGTVGDRYRVTNHIVTAGGREDDRTLTIQIRER